MIKMDMKFAEALVIASNFEKDKFTDEQRLKAIYMIKDAPTLNSVSKDKLQNALNWLFDYCFEDAEEPQTNYERIKAMTVEEIAVFFAKAKADLERTCRQVIAYKGEDVNENIEWLNSEVQVDE